jgi:F-type H+-transporting ATPase subunit delta
VPADKASAVADKVVVSGVSGRYALALFDLALDAKMVDQVAADLDNIAGTIKGSADFARVVESPLYGQHDQAGVMEAISKAAKLSDLTRRFLGVLAHNRRLTALLSVIGDFHKLLAQHKGEVTAEVISAQKLSATQVTALKKQLKLTAGRDVNVEASVDESLLGGLVVKLGSQMIDSSLRTKLDNLQISMKEVG